MRWPRIRLPSFETTMEVTMLLANVSGGVALANRHCWYAIGWPATCYLWFRVARRAERRSRRTAQAAATYQARAWDALAGVVPPVPGGDRI